MNIILNQSIFEGMDKRYRWACVNRNGEVVLFTGESKPRINTYHNEWWSTHSKPHLLHGSCVGHTVDGWKTFCIYRQNSETPPAPPRDEYYEQVRSLLDAERAKDNLQQARARAAQAVSDGRMTMALFREIFE